MSTINLYPSNATKHKNILDKFPTNWQPKLLAYTTEELFYFYKLCCMTVKHNRIWVNGEWQEVGVKDIFFLGLRAKFYRFMKGEIKTFMSGDIWIKLHHKFKHKFDLYMEEIEEEKKELEHTKTVEMLSYKFNNKRYA